MGVRGGAVWSQLPSPLTTQAKSKKTGAFVSRDRAQPQTIRADAFVKSKFKKSILGEKSESNHARQSRF